MLLSSQLLAEVEEVADHVTMISQGKVVLSGPLAALKRDAQVAGEREPTIGELFFAHVGTHVEQRPRPAFVATRPPSARALFAITLRMALASTLFAAHK